MKTILVILCLFFALPAQAEQITFKRWDLGTVVNEKPMNGEPATLTFYVDRSSDNRLGGYTKLHMIVNFTRITSGVISTTCTVGRLRGTATATMTTCTVAAGVCTLNITGAGVMKTISLSASTEYTQEIGISAWPVIKCVTAHDNTPGAGDILSIDAWLSN